MGVPVVCGIDKNILGVIRCVTGQDTVPYLGCTIATLEEELLRFCGRKAHERAQVGDRARDWMFQHWHPRDIAGQFCDDLRVVPKVSEVRK